MTTWKAARVSWRKGHSQQLAAHAGETVDNYYQPLEKAELVRSGRDVTILCYSRMRYVVMQAVQQLELQGYDPEVHPVLSPTLPLEAIIAGSGTFQPVETVEN